MNILQSLKQIICWFIPFTTKKINITCKYAIWVILEFLGQLLDKYCTVELLKNGIQLKANNYKFNK